MTNQDLNRELLHFIDKSPSSFHVIANLEEKFKEAGYVELKEWESWELTAGKTYYVTRNDSSLIAFGIPKGEVRGFHMVASHSDSPGFKIKENPEKGTDSRYVLLNTEKYGGMLLSTWLDRPLSVAGRIVLKAKQTANTKGKEDVWECPQMTKRLVNIDKDLCVIPNVAIHMNRDANKGMEYNPQTDMLPLYGQMENDTKEGMLIAEIAETLGVKTSDIYGQDLFLYVREKGRILGRNGEFILSPRLDDLQCVFASAEAMVRSIPQNYVSLCAVFDNEEVGSTTRQGAASTFLEDVIERISASLVSGQVAGGLEHVKQRLIAGSFLISADNAHGVHPNHPEKADPTNRPYLNGGIVIKFHGGQKYTTDGVSAAYVKLLCEKAGVPWQTYANRSDIPGGSTLGNISTAHVPVRSADIGLPQLAMHSAVETAGTADLGYAINVFETFFTE